MDFAEFRQLMCDRGPKAAAQYLVDHYHTFPQDEQIVWLVVFGANFLEYKEAQAQEELREYIQLIDEAVDFKEVMEECKAIQYDKDY